METSQQPFLGMGFGFQTKAQYWGNIPYYHIIKEKAHLTSPWWLSCVSYVHILGKNYPILMSLYSMILMGCWTEFR